MGGAIWGEGVVDEATTQRASRIATSEQPVSEVCIEIRSDRDMEEARAKAKEMASGLGFVAEEVPFVATAASVLARNKLAYGCAGQIVLKAVYEDPRYSIVIAARYEGPSIPDADMVMRDLTVGLSGVNKRLDEFRISCKAEERTEIIVMKWLRGQAELPGRLSRNMHSIT